MASVTGSSPPPAHEEEQVLEGEDAFEIPSKNASQDQLRWWRIHSRPGKEEKENLRRMLRSHAQVIRAVFLFKEAGQKNLGEYCTSIKDETLSQRFSVDLKKLKMLNRDHDTIIFQEVGGVKGLSDLLKSDLDEGVSPDENELMRRRDIFGANTYPRKERRSVWYFVFEACQDLTLVILMVAAAISLSLGMATEGVKDGWYDGGTTSDYRQSLQFQHLNEEKRNIQVEVIRGGKRLVASIFDLVVGDVVPLKIGDQVPADDILIYGHFLAIDELSMTRESKIVNKDQRAPFLMSGCKVADGYGSMLVTGVGINTEWGMMMANLSEDTGEETPLQVRLNGVANLIGSVGLSVAGAVLVVLWLRYFTGHTKNPDGTTQFLAGTTGVKQGFMGAIRILTIAQLILTVVVPKGLPLAVTLTLSYSMRKMRDKALVRRLSSCETMGSATTICSDKTGTLTMNKMTVVEAYLGGKKMDPYDNASAMCTSVTALLIEGIAHNTTGTVFMPEDGGATEVTGSPTEKAILSWGLKIGMDFKDVRSKSSVLHVLPFNSEKKRGGVALQSDTEVHIHWKGAAELLLASCRSWLSTDSSVQPMNSIKHSEFKKSIDDMAVSSLRCVAFAYCPWESKMVPTESLDKWKLPEDDLTLIGVVGIKADIGLSMGISGTEVAKESSDIIILDDDFTSVVKVVRWGRSVYANIQKFIQFQLTVNVAALVINVVAAVSSGDIPLNAVELLWVNLIMDTLGALALATEPPTDNLMKRHPVGRREPLVTNVMWRNLFIQIFNEFNARKPEEKNVFKGVTNNHLFMAIVGATTVLQILMIEFLGKFFDTAKLNSRLWLLSVAIGAVSWPLAYLGKFFPVPARPLQSYFKHCSCRRGPHRDEEQGGKS
ncbi:unnamed protein product [Miscanthus lutarioriparius]|uniref:Cation-transporting P-type ATPase N-terminal domain-containing protein n=1 Tax=Miscanthus lutarioriparius TaxID=422564 RepID=A0A811NLB4_9POAL|nr:unnamed protein product [Miscanthus lutarioriparius]